METAEVGCRYYLTPIAGTEDGTAEETIRKLVSQDRYVFGDRTAGLRHFKPGDRLCFYISRKGIGGEAKILSSARPSAFPLTRGRKDFHFECSIGEARLFLDKPIQIDSKLRSQLDAFRTKDPDRNWALFVRTTRRVTENDFRILTGHSPKQSRPRDPK